MTTLTRRNLGLLGAAGAFAIEYARRLIAAGVPTELHVAPGAFHGFELFSQTRVAQQFRAALNQALARAFGGGQA
jgi:acetyl esterase/lipase